MSTKAAQSSTHVKDALNSVRELGMSYNDSGRLKCLYLKGGVSECEWVKVSSFNEMVVMGISYLKVSWLLMNFFEVLSAWELREKLSALQLQYDPVPWRKISAGWEHCWGFWLHVVLLIEIIESLNESRNCSTFAVKLCCGICSGYGATLVCNN